MTLIEKLNAAYFNHELSDTVLQNLQQVENQSQQAQDFVARLCRQLHHQQLKGKDFTELMAWVGGQMLDKLLPVAWGGKVPPITIDGRHVLVDEYLARNPWRPMQPGDTFLDLGCGYPPVTTLDTAKRFPEIQVIGADVSFGAYMIREDDGTYALLNEAGELLYYQVGRANPMRWNALSADPQGTRDYFRGIHNRLGPSLPGNGDTLSSVREDDVELVKNPIMDYHTDRVSFLCQGIGSPDMPRVQMARCFNVLFYFDRPFRERALAWMGEILDEGGLLVSGGNSSSGRTTRYTVHRLECGVMQAREFAFSVENIRPIDIVAVFAMHDDDYETAAMATLIRTLRQDERFCRDIEARFDEIQADIGYCPRKADGYLGSVDFMSNPDLMQTAMSTIGSTLEQEGYARRAVEVLNGQGYQAWENCLGHIAVNPAGLPMNCVIP